MLHNFMSLRDGVLPLTLAPHCVWRSAGEQSPRAASAEIALRRTLATLEERRTLTREKQARK